MSINLIIIVFFLKETRENWGRNIFFKSVSSIETMNKNNSKICLFVVMKIIMNDWRMNHRFNCMEVNLNKMTKSNQLWLLHWLIKMMFNIETSEKVAMEDWWSLRNRLLSKSFCWWKNNDDHQIHRILNRWKQTLETYETKFTSNIVLIDFCWIFFRFW